MNHKLGITPSELADAAYDIMVPFVDTFIEFEKPLIALVNGPAIGNIDYSL